MTKKITLFSLLLIMMLGINISQATVVVIQCSGTSGPNQFFTPNVAHANCGDTIKWVLVSGTHTCASTTIPSGATPWSSPNITANPGYTRVLTIPGTYNYTCHPLTGGHMDASIIVTCTTGIPSIEPGNLFSVYPNPSSGKITVELQNQGTSNLDVYNVLGEKVYQSLITSPVSEVNLAIPSGIYFYELKDEEKLIGKGKLIIR